MEELSPQIQQQIVQFQAIQQQVQTISSQRVQMEIQLNEVERATEELEKLKKDAEVYKNIGTLFIKKDKDEVTEELKDKKETFAIMLKKFQKQEKDLQAKLGEMQSKIQDRIKSGNPPAG